MWKRGSTLLPGREYALCSPSYLFTGCSHQVREKLGGVPCPPLRPDIFLQMNSGYYEHQSSISTWLLPSPLYWNSARPSTLQSKWPLTGIHFPPSFAAFDTGWFPSWNPFLFWFWCDTALGMLLPLWYFPSKSTLQGPLVLLTHKYGMPQCSRPPHFSFCSLSFISLIHFNGFNSLFLQAWPPNLYLWPWHLFQTLERGLNTQISTEARQVM